MRRPKRRRVFSDSSHVRFLAGGRIARAPFLTPAGWTCIVALSEAQAARTAAGAGRTATCRRQSIWRSVVPRSARGSAVSTSSLASANSCGARATLRRWRRASTRQRPLWYATGGRRARLGAARADRARRRWRRLVHARVERRGRLRGGGTGYGGGGEAVQCARGEILSFDAKLRHGRAITRGTRLLLVGFAHTRDARARPRRPATSAPTRRARRRAGAARADRGRVAGGRARRRAPARCARARARSRAAPAADARGGSRRARAALRRRAARWVCERPRAGAEGRVLGARLQAGRTAAAALRQGRACAARAWRLAPPTLRRSYLPGAAARRPSSGARRCRRCMLSRRGKHGLPRRPAARLRGRDRRGVEDARERRRVTLLVNVWRDSAPAGVAPLPESTRRCRPGRPVAAPACGRAAPPPAPRVVGVSHMSADAPHTIELEDHIDGRTARYQRQRS